MLLPRVAGVHSNVVAALEGGSIYLDAVGYGTLAWVVLKGYPVKPSCVNRRYVDTRGCDIQLNILGWSKLVYLGTLRHHQVVLFSIRCFPSILVGPCPLVHPARVASAQAAAIHKAFVMFISDSP